MRFTIFDVGSGRDTDLGGARWEKVKGYGRRARSTGTRITKALLTETVSRMIRSGRFGVKLATQYATGTLDVKSVIDDAVKGNIVTPTMDPVSAAKIIIRELKAQQV